MGSLYPERAVPISLSTNYLLTTDQRMMIITSMHIPKEFLSFSSEFGKQQATIRIAGLISNERGQAGANFTEGIAVSRDSTDPSESGQTVSYTHQIFLSPGLYQVRVAARDEQSGRTGSAHSWIEIPDLASGHLDVEQLTDWYAAAGRCGRHAREWRAGHGRYRHPPSVPAWLCSAFFLSMYNAARANSDSKSDLATRVLILRDNQPVVTTDFKKMATEDGVALGLGLPYAADLSLATLPPGRYILQMEVIDRVSKRRASQQTRFEIE